MIWNRCLFWTQIETRNVPIPSSNITVLFKYFNTTCLVLYKAKNCTCILNYNSKYYWKRSFIRLPYSFQFSCSYMYSKRSEIDIYFKIFYHLQVIKIHAIRHYFRLFPLYNHLYKTTKICISFTSTNLQILPIPLLHTLIRIVCCYYEDLVSFWNFCLYYLFSYTIKYTKIKSILNSTTLARGWP